MRSGTCSAVGRSALPDEFLLAHVVTDPGARSKLRAMPTHSDMMTRVGRVVRRSVTASGAALNQREFDALLAWLAPARDQAGERYESTRRMLTRYFEWRRCVPADEYVDETIDRVARRLAAGEQIVSADPNAYFRGVARNVCFECRKHEIDGMRAARLCLPTASDRSPLPACLEYCLHRMSRDRRELFEAYYLRRREELPASLGITPNAVRLRVFKEKRKLRDCIARCSTLMSFSSLGTGEIEPAARMLRLQYRSQRK